METFNALITGGSRGIGRATARRFLKEGAFVSIASRHEASLDKALDELHIEGNECLHGMVADVRDPVAVNEWVEETEKELGRPTVLVNCAGIARIGDFADAPVEEIKETLDTNLFGVLNTTRQVLPKMLEAEDGRIINISSGAGLHGIPRLATYSASKFGVCGFSEALDEETNGDGVRVFMVCPGAVATDMQVDVSGRKVGIPPEEVAETVFGLASGSLTPPPGKCVQL